MKKEPIKIKKTKKRVLNSLVPGICLTPGSVVNSSDLYIVKAQPTVLEIEKMEKKASKKLSKL